MPFILSDMCKKGINWPGILYVVLILLFLFSSRVLAFPDFITYQEDSNSQEKGLAQNHLSLTPSSPTILILKDEEKITEEPREKLKETLDKLAKDPYFDDQISSTYHQEGCYDFIEEVFENAGLDFARLQKRFQITTSLKDGDLIKIQNSVFEGLPHWGIYYNGLVYHNWDGFRAEPLSYFLKRYPLPDSSPVYFSLFFKTPASLTSLPR